MIENGSIADFLLTSIESFDYIWRPDNSVSHESFQLLTITDIELSARAHHCPSINICEYITPIEFFF